MKNNKYNVLFYRQIFPVLMYGVVTYLLALRGFGVFALIIGHIFGRVMTVCFLLIKSKWKPRIYFDLSVFKRLFVLGRHILTQSILGLLITQADSLIVGKILGVYSLGFYRTGNTLAHLIPNAFSQQVQKVVFSDIAQRKKDYNYYTLRYYQFFYIMGSISFILSIMTYFLSPLVIPAIMGSKWNQMIPLVQIFSVVLPTGMIAGLNYDYSRVLGFSGIYTIFMIIRVAVTLIAIYIGSLFSLEFTVICVVIVSLMDNVANEICFFRNQTAIKYKNTRFILFVFAYVWALYVIMQHYLKA